MTLCKIYKSNTSNYPQRWTEFMSKTFQQFRHGAYSKSLKLLCVSAKCYCSNSRCCLCQPVFLHTQRSISRPYVLAWVHWGALFKLKIFNTHSQALMPRCPTFRDGLNLCPQMRQINPDSADIISRSSLRHRRNSRHRSTAVGSPLFPRRLILIPIGSQRKKLKSLARKSLYSQAFQWRRCTQ